MKNELVLFAVAVFTGFFAVMNPIANLPVFLGLTTGADRKTSKTIARNGTFTAFIIVALFVFFGKFIFDMFNITIPAFKMAGGILLFHVGFDMLQSKAPSLHTQSVPPIDEGVAISPLAIPILAGPGTIVTAVNYAAGATYTHIAIIVTMFALMTLLNYFAFASSDVIVKKLGNGIISVVGKIMGLILAIMGMDMLTDGIKLTFKIGS